MYSCLIVGSELAEQFKKLGYSQRAQKDTKVHLRSKHIMRRKRKRRHK